MLLGALAGRSLAMDAGLTQRLGRCPPDPLWGELFR